MSRRMWENKRERERERERKKHAVTQIGEDLKRRQRRSHSVAGKPATREVSFNRCTSPGDRPDGSTKQTGSAGSPPRAFHNKTDTTVFLQNNALKYDTLSIKTRLCPDKMSLTSCCLAVSCAALLARIPGGGSE